MDEIDENNSGGYKEEDLVNAVDTKLGPEENRIRHLIAEELSALRDNEKGKNAEDNELKPTYSTNLKMKLDEEFGGNWNVVIGANFASVLGLLPEDRYGHFTLDSTNIIVFETSGRRT